MRLGFISHWCLFPEWVYGEEDHGGPGLHEAERERHCEVLKFDLSARDNVVGEETRRQEVVVRRNQIK